MAYICTGVQIAAGNTTGSIGVSGSGADIELPAAFQAESYSFQGSTVTLDQCVRVFINPVSSGALTNLAPSVAYAGTLTGLNPASFRINITNTSASLATQTLAILIQNVGAGHVTAPARIG